MDSETFNFEKSHELNMTEMALMNANTTILPHNQPHEVQFGQMELHKKSFYEIVSPYILKMAQETGSFAMMAGSTAFDKIKNGLLWVYDKIKNTIIPYVSENAPKVIFLISNKDKKIVQAPEQIPRMSIDDIDYVNLKGTVSKKAKIIIPMGNAKNNEEFIKDMQKHSVSMSMSFQIDNDDDDDQPPSQAFIVPRETFQAAFVSAEAEKKKEGIINPSQRLIQMNGYYCFEFERQNSIEYDMLQKFTFSNNAQTGYLVFPKEVLRKSQQIESHDSSSQGSHPDADLQQISDDFVQRVTIAAELLNINPLDSNNVEQAAQQVYSQQIQLQKLWLQSKLKKKKQQDQKGQQGNNQEVDTTRNVRVEIADELTQSQEEGRQILFN